MFRGLSLGCSLTIVLSTMPTRAWAGAPAAQPGTTQPGTGDGGLLPTNPTPTQPTTTSPAPGTQPGTTQPAPTTLPEPTTGPTTTAPAPATEVGPDLRYEPQPTPAPVPTTDVVAGQPTPVQPAQPTPDSQDLPKWRVRAAGAMLLGAGIGFSVASFAGLVAKAGHTDLGQQGLVTFDPYGVDVQWRIPRAAMGVSAGVLGAVLSGVGGSLFAANGNDPSDPTASRIRMRRARTGGAVAIGLGSAVAVSGAALLIAAGGEWASIPAGTKGALPPEQVQSGHNTAAFISWGLGLFTLGMGAASAGLGLFTGANKARARLGVTASRTGGGLTLTKRF